MHTASAPAASHSPSFYMLSITVTLISLIVVLLFLFSIYANLRLKHTVCLGSSDILRKVMGFLSPPGWDPFSYPHNNVSVGTVFDCLSFGLSSAFFFLFTALSFFLFLQVYFVGQETIVPRWNLHVSPLSGPGIKPRTFLPWDCIHLNHVPSYLMYQQRCIIRPSLKER